MADRISEQAIPREIDHPRQLALPHHGRPRTATTPGYDAGPSKATDRGRASSERSAMPSVVAPRIQTGPSASVTSGSPVRHESDHAHASPLSRERLALLRPQFGAIAHRLASALPRPQTVELIDCFVAPFAMQAQCAFLGQPADIEAALRCWIRPCQARIFRGEDDRGGASPSALFGARLEAVLHARRASAASSPNDVIGALIDEQVWGRVPSDRDMLAILHAWTAGAVDEITRTLRVLVRHLAEHPGLQADLLADPDRLSRTVTAALRAAGHELGSPVGLHWAFGEDARVRWMPRPSMPENGSGWQFRTASGDDVRLWPDVLQVQVYESIRALLTILDSFEPVLTRTSLVARCSTSRYPTLALRIR